MADKDQLISAQLINTNQFIIRYLNKGRMCFLVKDLDFTKASEEIAQDIISQINLINKQ